MPPLPTAPAPGTPPAGSPALPLTPVPPLAPVLTRAREAIDEAAPGLDPGVGAHWRGRIAVYEDLVAQLVELERAAEIPAVDAPSSSRG